MQAVVFAQNIVNIGFDSEITELFNARGTDFRNNEPTYCENVSAYLGTVDMQH
jgi:hypothetical protein